MIQPSLEALLSWWAGYRFEIGNVSPASCPRVFSARGGRRAVTIGLHWQCEPGDSVRLKTGRFVELDRYVGSTDQFQVWAVVR